MDLKDIKKEYNNGEVSIVWQSGKCTHYGNCVKNSPDVFKPKKNRGLLLSIQQQKK